LDTICRRGLHYTAQYTTDDPTSFAHTSARERWPIIITQGIDDVHRSIHDIEDEEKLKEGKWIVSELAKLKYELQHNRELTPIHDDGEPDVEVYNKELAARGKPKWHSVAWLYSECYLYRCVTHTCKRRSFSTNRHRQTHIKHFQAD
jgi:damage-control phosphatase, subfamily III